MTQLKLIMGEDNFFKGINKFLTQFSWGNVVTDDLFGYLKPYY